MDYKELLAGIAKDKGDIGLSEWIMKYEKPVEMVISSGEPPVRDTPKPYTTGVGKFNITKMPEATCDGCQ